MPLYSIVAKDKPNGVEHRMAVRPEHLKHLDRLGQKLVMAGPFQSEEGKPTGSFMVIEAADLTEASNLFNKDPFITQGVFASYEISRWSWGINNPDKRGQ
jgi:uncharacterized protein YciI